MESVNTVRVGDWTADRLLGRFTRGRSEHPVEPMVMDLLLVLATRPGRVFGHEELRQALWPTVVVGDDSLARCVSKLRAALKRLEDSTVWIETIPKRGYRLVVPTAANPVRPIPAREAPKTHFRAMTLTIAALLLAVLALLASGMEGRRAERATKAEIARLRALAEADERHQRATLAPRERPGRRSPDS